MGDDYALPERPRECDLVMKGGLTSGVVYPLAICKLARHYRLRSIGGASAGAIAAAGAAAAEYARRTGTRAPGSGFAALEDLPRQLTEKVAGRARLLSLFQPEPSTAKIFDALLMVMDRPHPLALAARAIALVCGHNPGFALGALAVVGSLAIALARGHAEPVAWIVFALAAACTFVIGLTLATVAFVRSGLAALHDNGAGVCRGYSADTDPAVPPLCTWFADLFDTVAGRDPAGAPLTFGDLARQEIELLAISTNLTHGRPYNVPFDGEDFFFRIGEMRALFPPRVVAHMVAAARARLDALAARPIGELTGGEADVLNAWRAQPAPAAPDDELLPLPGRGDLPVIVAVRMSISFPVLLSAVPLHAVDWSRRKNHEHRAQAQLERCWFSDGGMCSNMPIHFFDSLLPTRPTFALNLKSPHPDFPVGACEADNVYMPYNNRGGVNEYWTPLGDAKGGLSALSLLGASIQTMQNWNDNMQARVPGFRDRIVHISHTDDEGGLNLNMDAAVVQRLAERGAAAGDKVVDRFVHKTGWSNHLWVRYRSALSMLEQLLGRVYVNYFEDPERHEELVQLLACPPSYPFKRSCEADVARKINEGFKAFGADIKALEARLGQEGPRPRADLRARPRHT